MRSAKTLALLAAAGLVAACALPAASPDAARPPGAGLGRPVTEAMLAAWDIDVRTPDGRGLPAGSGSVAAGRTVYEAKCIACHGAEGKGGPVYGPLVGGIGSFTTERRVVTVGSMYPYAPVLFDYVRRAMPMDAPQSLSIDEVYAVSAYLLHLNGLVPADAVMDRAALTQVRMPNRDGFVADDRPDTRAARCMAGCRPIGARP